MGNLEIMKRADIQMTSAGTGIAHSEYNRNPSKQVHFLQIWGLPNKRGLSPKYYNRYFSDEEKRDKLVKVVPPAESEGVSDERDAKGSAPDHAALSMYASIPSSEAPSRNGRNSEVYPSITCSHGPWGPLRVINETRVDAGNGFGTHQHRNFEF
ncbi:hypothetical protein JCM10449v2_001200 [Rhodotorula kratochvilovae]